MSEALTKQQIRQHFLNLRADITKDKRNEIESSIVGKAVPYITKKYKAQKNIIAGYFPIGSELNIIPLLDELNHLGYLLALPAMVDRYIIKFFAWAPGEPLNKRNFYNIPEPVNQDNELIPDLVIAPLIACDRTGNRIGYGTGCYDRYLRRIRSESINSEVMTLCSELFIVESISTKEYDQKVDVIISEKEIVHCSAGNGNKVSVAS